MKSVPLYLKVKTGSGSPQFACSHSNAICFRDSNYEFSSIFENSLPPETLGQWASATNTLILVGPTASGKTTSLAEILHYYTTTRTDASVSACEVHRNRSFVDLLDNKASKRYLASCTLESQLSKLKLTPASLKKLLGRRASCATSSNSHSSRSCLIVSIHSGGKSLAVVDMMGNEKFDPATSNSFANSNVSSLTRHLLSGTSAPRSHNLVTNLIFRNLPSINVNFLLHLDQCGNPDLIKSSLTNIVHAVKSFRYRRTVGHAESSSSASEVPGYARPTLSSLSPTKKMFRTKVFRVEKPPRTPSRSRLRDTNSKISPSEATRRSTSPGKKLDPSTIETLKSECSRLETKLHEEKLSFANTVKSLRCEVEQIRSASLSSLKSGLSTIRSDFDRLCHERETQRRNIESLENDLQLANARILSTDSQVTEAHETLVAKEAELESAKLDFEQETKHLKESHAVELAQMESAVAELEQKYSATRSAKDDLETSLATKMSENSKFEAQLMEARDKTSSTEKTMADLQTQMADSENQIVELKYQLDNAAVKEAAQIQAHSEMTQKLLDYEKQVETLQNLQNLHGQQIQREQELTRQLQQLEEEKMQQIKCVEQTKTSLEQSKLKCQQLEKMVTELNSAVKETELRSQREIKQLGEELQRSKESTVNMKKTIEYPELDFGAVNSFPSIDIFEDHTDYMNINLFKKPASGRSPAPSPSRVLKESNVRSSNEMKHHKPKTGEMIHPPSAPTFPYNHTTN